MAGQYLMERAGERMNVPATKLEKFLADGWKVIKMPDENRAVVVDQPLVEIPEMEEPEEPKVPDVPKVLKRSRKASK